MGIRPFVLLAFLVINLPWSAVASCETQRSADLLIQCFLEKHPNLGLSKTNIDIAKGAVNESSQMINPSLEWQTTEAQNSSGFANELNLKHTIELGSKRSARKKLALVRQDLEVIGFEKVYNQLKIDLIMDLYRLRQIEHEAEVIQENQATFKSMISQYRRNGRLNPEQEISVDIFSMAAEEVRLKLQRLQNERDLILSELEVINQSAFVPTAKQLPPVEHVWPQLDGTEIQGALIKEATLKVEESDRNYKLEVAKAWPNLAIGPRLLNTPGPQGGTFWGGVVSLKLPLLSLNGGGKEKATAIKTRAKMNKAILNKRILAEARRLKKVYQRSSRSYTKALKSNDIHKKHKRIHGLIQRGVVSPPLVIELHRQTIEFFEALHQQELAAVKARWLYYSLYSKLDKKMISATPGEL